MKFKHKALLGTIGLTIFVLAVQVAFQFMGSYRWVGFEKKQGSWFSIAQTAQGEMFTTQQSLDQCTDDKNELELKLNPDLK